jgi:hypothetical protein
MIGSSALARRGTFAPPRREPSNGVWLAGKSPGRCWLCAVQRPDAPARPCTTKIRRLRLDRTEAAGMRPAPRPWIRSRPASPPYPVLSRAVRLCSSLACSAEPCRLQHRQPAAGHGQVVDLEHRPAQDVRVPPAPLTAVHEIVALPVADPNRVGHERLRPRAGAAFCFSLPRGRQVAAVPEKMSRRTFSP